MSIFLLSLALVFSTVIAVSIYAVKSDPYYSLDWFRVSVVSGVNAMVYMAAFIT